MELEQSRQDVLGWDGQGLISMMGWGEQPTSSSDIWRHECAPSRQLSHDQPDRATSHRQPVFYFHSWSLCQGMNRICNSVRNY